MEVVPQAWQYPEITCCRIRLDGDWFESPGFVETPWSQAQDISGGRRQEGHARGLLPRAKAGSRRGALPFEERSLIRVIAERIGKILERHRAEEALRQSEQKTSALLSAIPDLMFQVNSRGILVGFHEGTYTSLGGIGKAMIGREVYDLAEQDGQVPRRLIEQGMLAMRRVMETGNPHVYEQHASIGGRRRDFEVRMVPCGSDEVLGIVRDITGKKQLEREILEISNREQRRIGQDLHDSLCQHLTGIGFMAKALQTKAAEAGQIEPGEVRDIVDLLDQAISMTREFARGLNPVELQADGLMHALETLAENVRRLFGVACSFTCEGSIFIHDCEKAATFTGSSRRPSTTPSSTAGPTT